MTLVTDALDRIARQCGVKTPTSWITATRDDHVELRDDFLLETVEDIVDRIDLPSPIGKQFSLTGTGVENYALPADFKRLARDELAVYDNDLDRKCEPITTDGEWTYVKDIGTTGIIRYYRLKGYDGNFTIDLYDEPTGTITVSYVSTVWTVNAGTEKSVFTAPEDELLLPRRVVEVGTIWRFRERRGLPYSDKFQEYEALMSRLINDARGRRVIQMGEPVRDVRWQDLIPAFIPPS